MWVYGDRTRLADPRAELAALRTRLEALDAPSPPIERHARLAAAFIAAAELAQGLADAAMDAAGGLDTPSREEDAATALLMTLAGRLDQSWRALPLEGGGEGVGVLPLAVRGQAREAPPPHGTVPDRPAPIPIPDPSPFEGEGSLPAQVRLKSAEGYAFYALYPEAYAAAAGRLSAGPEAVVIGVRSIGLGLAAVVASALGAEPPFSVRPTGHPFRRELKLGPALEAALRARAHRPFVVVDEGPGLSGSSFGAVADALERLGVARERIAFLPGHSGDLGAQASADHRARWVQAERPVVGMDALLLMTDRPGHRLAGWFADLTGDDAALQDVSGGAWRALRYAGEDDWPAVDAFQERRKFRLDGPSGRWLLKFQGLGATGERAFDAARRLGDAGWSPPAAALRYGFVATEWIDGRGLEKVTNPFLTHLGLYLGWRATRLQAPPHGGATLSELREMLRANAAEALGEAAVAGAPWLDPGRWADAPPLRRVWTDNRLHAREWLATPDGRWLKTDAVDHACAHDLVGAQDLAWDLAGAAVEFDLNARQAARLLAVVCEQAPVEPELVRLLQPAYLAFQLGLWSLAADAHADWPAEAARLRRTADGYRRRLAAHLRAR